MIDFSGYIWSDTNADGYLDTGVLDVDGNGYAETVAYDGNEDGVVDGVGQDANGNGVLEYIWTDQYSGDGSFSTVAVDGNEDGTLDVVYLPDGSVLSPTLTDAVLDNTYVGGGTTNPLLTLPSSAYTDPVTGPMISNILEQQAITSEIWALPDNMEIRYEYDY
jgi:hypothetical protein